MGGPRFIVLGYTESVRTSKRIMGRYKSEEELRDVFKVSRLRKQARRLLVFKVVDVIDEDTWYLISFDIKEVIGRKTGLPRKATKEYTIIKEGMFWNLCGRIDNSTYICPKDFSGIPRKFTDLVEVWPVKPYDDKTLDAMRNAVSEALLWVKLQLIMQAKKLHGKGKEKAKELVRRTETLMKSPWKHKVEKLLKGEVGLNNEVERLKQSLGVSNRLDTPKPKCL